MNRRTRWWKLRFNGIIPKTKQTFNLSSVHYFVCSKEQMCSGWYKLSGLGLRRQYLPLFLLQSEATDCCDLFVAAVYQDILTDSMSSIEKKGLNFVNPHLRSYNKMFCSKLIAWGLDSVPSKTLILIKTLILVYTD